MSPLDPLAEAGCGVYVAVHDLPILRASERARMESLRGRLLISSGGLYDPNFRHTVVLVGEHTPDGALGVVLNRALDARVDQAVPVLSGLVGADEPLFQGGPVQPHSPVLLAELVDRADARVRHYPAP